MKIICDWQNCNEIGSYKAPVEKDNSKKFRMLCLKHVKEFNKNWNYFENMNDQEVEFFIKSDLTWHKSTKTFGSSENFFNILWNNALDDKLNIFKSSNFREFKKTKLSQTDKDALEVMELNDQVLVQDRLRNAVLAKVEKHQALSDDEIRVVCPVAFKETMSSKEIRNLGLSKHYSFVPTSNVINDLCSMGWEVVDAKQKLENLR